MRNMHLVSDEQNYALAVRLGLPFFWTACSLAEPLASLSLDPRAVDCPACLSILRKASAAAFEEEEFVEPDQELEIDVEEVEVDLDVSPSAHEEDPEFLPRPAPRSGRTASPSHGVVAAPAPPVSFPALDVFAPATPRRVPRAPPPDDVLLSGMLAPPGEGEGFGEGTEDVRRVLLPEERERMGTLLTTLSGFGFGSYGLPILQALFRLCAELSALGSSPGEGSAEAQGTSRIYAGMEPSDPRNETVVTLEQDDSVSEMLDDAEE